MRTPEFSLRYIDAASNTSKAHSLSKNLNPRTSPVCQIADRTTASLWADDIEYAQLALCYTPIAGQIPHRSELTLCAINRIVISDMSEVFVFVSGYTCMLAYGGALREQGWLTIATRALRRAGEIYPAFLFLLIASFIIIWPVGNRSHHLDETNTRVFFENPGRALLHAAILQYTPINTDILPIFVLLHLAFPVVLWLLIHRGTAALALSFLFYLMVQMFGWNLPGMANR